MKKNVISYYSLILNVSTHVVSASLFQLKIKNIIVIIKLTVLTLKLKSTDLIICT